jgi:hypothetical protein
MADAITIIGYSERGIVNSLLYEISYSDKSKTLLEQFLALAYFPYTRFGPIQVSGAEILIEQSFSDFGDADAVLLIETGNSAVSIFIEAKVKPFQVATWSIEEEFNKFKAGTESTVSSSNLFTQLYHKVRLVNGLQEGDVDLLMKGLPFPSSSSKQTRYIGTNKIVLRAVERLQAYIDESYFIALVPEDPAQATAFYDNVLKSEAPEDFPEWDVTRYGYVCWSEIEAFCTKNRLNNTLRVFEHNKGQIYG